MVKDSKKYGATGGWGFGDFTEGKPADEAKHKTCFPCHEPAKAQDFVDTRYAPFNESENEALHTIQCTPWLGSENMANVTYEKDLTALLVIDPYNDFISEGGKIWGRIRVWQKRMVVFRIGWKS